MLTKVQPSPLPRPTERPEWLTTARRAALAAAWAAQRPGTRERFLAPEHPSRLRQTWVTTTDGWSLPLWHRPAPPDADGAPVLLAVGPGLRPGCLDMRPDRSLVQALHAAGHDVYLLSHRGDPHAQPPANPAAFDFDDLVEKDLQAALDAIRSRTCTHRALFVGHGLGGLLFIAHLARVGKSELAGGVALNAPVRFTQSVTRAREVHRIASLLPPHWSIPHRAIQRCLLAGGRDATLQHQAYQVDGPTLRRLALDHTSDLSAGLIQQIGRWHTTGRLCDREDRFDDIAALEGLSFPLLSITGDADPTCPPGAVDPLTHALSGAHTHHLTGGWGHLDPIVGAAASRDVFPRIVQWLAPLRGKCWDRDM